MTAINEFLLANGFDLKSNPCVSPDYCLDWSRCQQNIRNGSYQEHGKSRIDLPQGALTLVEDETGDHAWRLQGEKATADFMRDGVEVASGDFVFPASYENLIVAKNRIQDADPESTVFPNAAGKLGTQSIGVGARFTTLHWPAVEWAMAHLDVSMTANQNSIPRELVYDVDAMLEGALDSVPFPFIGADVPEGHQGQSVEGMSHGSILSKLKTGFHARRIPWSFNADHQPIGGKFDAREDQLVQGCLFASYITFDLSPELAQTQVPDSAEDRAAYLEREVPSALIETVRKRVADTGCTLDEDAFATLICQVWPAMQKMKRRDEKYAALRRSSFTAAKGQAYLRELSIDELPGLTTAETTAAMLAFCEAMDMQISFLAPAFGFQKNEPYPDNDRLRQLATAQWDICSKFGVSIGFHSGSGKSAENYQVMGEVTGSRLEIKTSGRYTYEMGVALSRSRDPQDAQLWQDWYAFTKTLAAEGAFAPDEVERAAARSFIKASVAPGTDEAQLFASQETCRQHLDTLTPSPDHMLFFEYNFLYVLAARGQATKTALGDHGPDGYKQRARFYSISSEARLLYARRVSEYLIFLCENTGLVSAERAAATRETLNNYPSYEAMLDDIAPTLS